MKAGFYDNFIHASHSLEKEASIEKKIPLSDWLMSKHYRACWLMWKGTSHRRQCNLQVGGEQDIIRKPVNSISQLPFHLLLSPGFRLLWMIDYTL